MTQAVIKWSKWISLTLLSLLCSLALFISVLLFTNPGLNLALWAAEKFVPQLKIESTSGALLPRFTLNHVQFKDDSLNVDLEASSITLAINASCLTEPSVCVDEVAIDGVSFVMPQLPPSSESQPETETTTGTKVTAPLPIAVRRIALTNIDLDVLENKIRWDNFATGISFSGNRLRVAKTALEGMKVALAQKSVDEQEVIHEPVENTSATEFELPKIELPHIELPLQIELSRLDVRNFELTQQTPVIVHHLGLEMNAVGSDIDIQRLELDMPQLSAQATTKVSLSENYPLNLALEALVKDPVANGQTLQLDVSGSADDLNLNAVLGGLVEAQLDAKLNPLNTTLPFELNIQEASVQYPLSGTAEYQVSIDKLHTSGSLKQYQLELATKVKGKQLPDLELSLQGEGTQSQIELSKVMLNTLGGSVSGDIMANWQTPINWAANLKLSHIQPGLQWQEAEGDISGELSTSGQLTDQGGWVVKLPKLDIDGVLRNYPLNIEGSLIASDRLGDGSINASTPRLALSHGPNTVTAKGSLNQEWNMDLALNLPDFIKTVPDLNGSASGSVFLRGSLKQPTLDLDLTVNDIDWAQQAQVASLTLKGSATPLPEPKANLSLQVKAARYQEQVIDHIKLTFAGSKQQHSANLDVSSNIASTSLAISGALEEKPDISWQGALERMSLTSEQGEWVLERSTELGFVMATKQVSVAAHCWLQAESSICLDNNISVGEVGEAAVSVNNFNIDQLKQYIPQQTEVIAKVDATAWAKWAPNQTPSVKASVILPKGSVTQQVERPLTLGWETIQINANLADSKLDASWLLDVIDNGDISGNMTIPDVQAEDKLIDGQFTLGRFNLDFLAPIIGEYSKLGSEITADLKLAGPAMQPEVEGQLKVDNILLRGDISPLQVESGEVVVDFAGYDADLTAQIHTPDGKLEMTGDANWADLKDWRTNLRVFADELRVEVPPMVKVKVQPDMTISATPSYAKVEGDISLPWGRIVVEELPPSAVSVSKDQVILDKDLQPVDDESSVPLAIETDININIGDDFKLLAFGLEGGLIGKLNVTQKDKGPFITGEINIQDGSYQSFGQDLIISEGKILMNGPADQPYVQITAIRNPDNTQDDVSAGVKVTGPANEPTVTIFSEPAMAQANALSYLLRGQDIDGESGGNSMTTTLIGLSLAKSGRVVGEIGEAFGVQDLQLDTAGSGDDSQVTVSGYILPGLQVKYGVGIFDSVGEFTVRYRLMQDLYVEAISGVDSAVDLLYQFEFN